MTYPLLLDGGVVAADDELLCGGGEVGQASDREVLVVHSWVFVNGVIGLIG